MLLQSKIWLQIDQKSQITILHKIFKINLRVKFYLFITIPNLRKQSLAFDYFDQENIRQK